MSAARIIRPRRRGGRRGGCALLLAALLAAACAGSDKPPSVRAGDASPVPAVRGYKVGKPYQIKGIWYYPQVDYEYAESGIASWYGPGFHGRSTASGETYDMNDLTAAHRTLPMPSIVRVTNLENGRSLKLRVNDRGPFYGDRIIDVSRRAAQMLGFYANGTASVQVDIVADESREIAAALGVPDTGGTLARVDAPAVPAEVAYAPAEPEVAAYEAAAVEPAAPLPAVDTAPDSTVDATVEIAPQPIPLYAAPALAAPLADSYMPAAEPHGGASLAEPHGGASLYVQAGAFADTARADHVRRRLSPFGPVVMTPSRVNGRELLRVRVGPLRSDAEAERVLASVSQAGFPDCRLIAE